MKKSLIIAIVIFAVVIGGIGWYGYSVFHARYEADAPPADTVLEREGGREEESDGSRTDHPPSVQNTGEETGADTSADGTEAESAPNVGRDADIPEVDIDTNMRDGVSDDVVANVTNDHCAHECEAFASDFSYLEYCRQVCGLEEPQDVSEDDCADLDGIRRDYCLKDAAITATDLSLCDDIADTNIRTTCTARVTEDLVEGI